MQLKSFAPIIITTLNRYNHFKRCLESLEKCTWAEKTRVYVALDYPPSEKYIDGWKKIDKYLYEKEKNNGFYSLIVYRRTENYFFSGNRNLSAAVNDLPEEDNTYIYSEDDNVFSLNFLDFMNKALVVYAKDNRIRSVCGYNGYKTFNDATSFLTADSCAWGLGIWKDKDQIYQNVDMQWYKSIILDFRMTLKLYKKYPAGAMMLLSSIKNNKKYGDACRTVCNIFSHTYQIRPVVSLVKNEGFDGSGLHCGSDASAVNNMEISNLLEYSLEGEPFVLDNDIEGKKLLFQHALSPIFFNRIRTHISFWRSYLKYRFF